jgi:SAM-dependent methyltransferase
MIETREIDLSPEEIVSLNEKILSNGGIVRTQVKGECLHPVVRDRDFVYIKSITVSQVRIADLVVYRIGPHGMHIYQVFKKPVQDEPGRVFLGKVIGIERNNRLIGLETVFSRLRSYLWLFMFMPKVLLRKLKSMTSKTPLGLGLRYLKIVILRPQDIVRLAARYYRDNPSNCAEYSADAGLNDLEEEILNKHMEKRGRLLVLGCGKGRESIAFAKAGFSVVGVDMVEELIMQARQRSQAERLNIDFICSEFSCLSLYGYSFDYILFSLWAYEWIPGRNRRVKILKILKNNLNRAGVLVLPFQLSEITPSEKRLFFLRKILAWMTLGNIDLQPGDRPHPAIGFTHAFGSEDEVDEELQEAGFERIEFSISDDRQFGYATTHLA